MNIRIAGLLVASLLVTACSDDEVMPPSPAPKFDETLSIRKVWSSSVGDGADDLFLNFTPAVTECCVYAVAKDGTVVKIDRRSGDRLWKVRTPYEITGGAAAGYGKVWFGTANGEAVALSDQDGSELSKTLLGGQVLSAPAVSLDRVVVQTIDGRLHGLSSETAKQVWMFDTSIPILTSRGESSPIILGGIVVGGFANGKLAALQVGDGLVGWEKPVAEPEGRSELERLVDIDGRFDVQGSTVFAATLQGKIAALDLPSGRTLWSKPFSSHSGLSVYLDGVYATSADSDIVAMDAASGTEQWRQDQLRRRAVTAPVAYGDYLVAGDFEGYLYWIRRSNGQFAARVRVDSGGLRSMPVVVDDVVYIQANDGDIAAYQIEAEEH